MARRRAPTWVATVVVFVFIAGYVVYSAARLRGAALERAKVPAEAGAAGARP